jgi:hypothetical protein
MSNRTIIMSRDFDPKEQKTIYAYLCNRCTSDAVVAVQARCCADEGTECYKKVKHDLEKHVEEFHEDCPVYLEGWYDEAEHMVLPVAFILHLLQGSGIDPSDGFLQFGYHLMQANEGIGQNRRPALLGKKRRDPLSDLDYDAVGW